MANEMTTVTLMEQSTSTNKEQPEKDTAPLEKKDAGPFPQGKDLDRSVEQLAKEVLPQLPEETRLKYGKLLQDAIGPAATSDNGGGLYELFPERLRRRLGLVQGKTITPLQAAELFAQLLDTLLTLEQLVWNMWKALAPESTIRKDPQTNDLRMLAGAYIKGEANASLDKVAGALDMSRQLIAGLLGAIGPIGRTYGRYSANRFSPEEIKKLVKMESQKFFVNQKARYWDKYTELASDLSEDTIEVGIHKAIVKYAEDLILSGKSSSP